MSNKRVSLMTMIVVTIIMMLSSCATTNSLAFQGSPDQFRMEIQNTHSTEILAMAISPDGNRVATIGKIETIKIWDSNGFLLDTVKGRADMNSTCLDFSPDGRFLAIGYQLDNILVYDTEKRTWSYFYLNGPPKGPRTFNQPGVSSVSFSPNGKRIYAGTIDGELFICTTDGTVLKKIQAHDEPIQSIEFRLDGDEYITTSKRGIARIWSSKHKLIKEMSLGSASMVSAQFSQSGDSIVLASVNQVEIRTPDNILIDKIQIDGTIQSIAFTSANEKIWILHNSSGSTQLTVWTPGVVPRNTELSRDVIISSAISPDGRFFTAGTKEGHVKMWSREKTTDIPTAIPVITLSNPTRIRVEFDSTGSYLLINNSDYAWSLDELRRINRDQLPVSTRRSSSDIEFRRRSNYSGYVISESKGIQIAWDENIIRLNVNGETERTITAPGNLTAIALKPDGTGFVASATEDLLFYNIEGRLIKQKWCGATIVRDMVYSSDGSVLATSHADHIVKLWDRNGIEKSVFRGHNTDIYSFQFSSDDQAIVSASTDGVINIWNLNNPKQYVTLLSLDNEWIIYTPDGYFEASRNGGQLVSMIQGNQAYSLDQFAMYLNRPDIILQRMGWGLEETITHYSSQVQRRFIKAGVTGEETFHTLQIPDTSINSSTRDGKTVTIKTTFTDPNNSLSRYDVYVNDVPIYGSEGRPLQSSSAQKLLDIELTNGINKIELSCRNSSGVESYRAIRSYVYEDNTKPDLYYLGFGVSDYKDNSLDLQYAHQDVLDTAELFQSMSDSFAHTYVKTYINEEVTTEAIVHARQFLDNAGPNDVVVLFIAGHGVYDQSIKANYYYLTYDADINNLKDTAAEFIMVEDLLQNIEPRRKLFLIDTCESGELDPLTLVDSGNKAESLQLISRGIRGLGKVAIKDENTAVRSYLLDQNRYIYNDLFRRSGAIIFSSSRGNELSYESSEYENGLFTEAILRCFDSNTADLDSDSQISTGELQTFVSDTVSENSGNLQHPTVDRDNIYQVFGFPVISENE